jgi:preprotein translocase subunit SecG
MQTVLLVIHLMIAVALIGTILLQRSEGGALGIGGGGGGGFMSGRGTANALTRLTAMLAAGFFVTCILLTLLARFDHQTRSIIDTIGKPAASVPAPASTTGATGSTATTAPGTAPAAPNTDTTSAAKSKFQDLQPIIPPANPPAAATTAEPATSSPAPTTTPASGGGKSTLPDLAPILPPDPGTPAKP